MDLTITQIFFAHRHSQPSDLTIKRLWPANGQIFLSIHPNISSTTCSIVYIFLFTLVFNLTKVCLSSDQSLSLICTKFFFHLEKVVYHLQDMDIGEILSFAFLYSENIFRTTAVSICWTEDPEEYFEYSNQEWNKILFHFWKSAQYLMLQEKWRIILETIEYFKWGIRFNKRRKKIY